jgi:UDP-3-O-[3-hydroxymyristoyl] glucosamine N-acyltransferase
LYIRQHEVFIMEQSLYPGAIIGHDVRIGRFAVIEPGAVVGDGCDIGHHVVIHGKARIGRGVRIDDHAVIGKLPMSARRSKTTDATRELAPALVGDNAIIGTAAIVYAGSSLGEGVLVADAAAVREDVTIGQYTIIGRNATVENRVKIGARCKIQAHVYICAYSEIGDDCFIAPCVATSNDNYAGRWKERTRFYKGVTVMTGGRIAVNATILPGKVIGSDGLVGAGSVVTRDVPEGMVVCGNPARTLRETPDNQLLANQEE